MTEIDFMFLRLLGGVWLVIGLVAAAALGKYLGS